MKTRARKFRIRRPPGGLGNAAAAQEAPATAKAGAATGQSASAAQSGQDNAPRGPADDARDRNAAPTGGASGLQTARDIDAIRREGLTGRQLRIARRMAQKHGLAPTSDFDAVRLLRAKGIDPFQRSNMLQLVSPAKSGDGAHVQLPQTIPAEKGSQLPSADVVAADRRAAEIMRVQRDIALRRRRRLALLGARLLAFVFLPTFIVGYYFNNIATPMFTTKSEFLILTADGLGASGIAKGLLSGTSFATSQDSIATQSYLESKDAMLRLDRDEGFRTHFSQPDIDPIQRLEKDASIETAFKLYRKYVKLGYDLTEGVIRMEVTTADPQVSKRFSEKLIAYAEERINELSDRKRRDALKTAAKSLAEAKAERRAAQERLVRLQEGSILDPAGEVASIRALIQNAELQLQEKQLALSTQLNNPRPNKAKVDALRSQIDVLEKELEKQQSRLTKASEGKSSLAAQSVAIEIAKADVATADMILQAALESKRQAEIEAGKQVRYLTVSVKPVAAQDPSYPRTFEDTLVAFLIFAGIYLMISLTASILREQVAS